MGKRMIRYCLINNKGIFLLGILLVLASAITLRENATWDQYYPSEKRAYWEQYSGEVSQEILEEREATLRLLKSQITQMNDCYKEYQEGAVSRPEYLKQTKLFNKYSNEYNHLDEIIERTEYELNLEEPGYVFFEGGWITLFDTNFAYVQMMTILILCAMLVTYDRNKSMENLLLCFANGRSKYVKSKIVSGIALITVAVLISEATVVLIELSTFGLPYPFASMRTIPGHAGIYNGMSIIGSYIMVVVIKWLFYVIGFLLEMLLFEVVNQSELIIAMVCCMLLVRVDVHELLKLEAPQWLILAGIAIILCLCGCNLWIRRESLCNRRLRS